MMPPPDEPPDEQRRGDPDRKRHQESHRVDAGVEEPPERAHDEADDDQSDDLSDSHAVECARRHGLRNAGPAYPRPWGSTSTDAVRPSRRMAGAAAASRRAAREATALGAAVLASSWARRRPRRRRSGAGPRSSRSSPAPSRPARSSPSRRRGGGLTRPRDDHPDQVAEGRVAELSPARELSRQELLDVVTGGQRDRAGVGLVRLDDHASGSVAPAPPRQLRDQLERPLLGPEVRKAEAGVRVDHGRERHALEVVALGDHLRPQEHPALAGGEASEDLDDPSGMPRGICVEPEALELGNPARELRLEPLRPGPEAGDLRRAARRARDRRLLPAAAVVAVESIVGVERQRHVAGGTPPRQAARAAVERGRDTAPVQEEDRLAAAVCERAQLCEERRRERVARLAPQVDDAHARKWPGEALAELEALEALPALRPRSRASVDRHGAFERGPLRRDGARVVARVGFLLVGRIVLLVDADEPERGDRGEHGRAGADDDPGLAGGDSRPLVPPLRLGEPRVEHRHAAAEAGPEPAQRLRRERDLRHQHDRPPPARQSLGAGAEVDLRLPAPGLPVEEERPTGAVEGVCDPLHGPLLGEAERGGSLLGGQLVLDAAAARAGAPRAGFRGDQGQRPCRRGAVVVGEPEGEVEEGLRDGSEHVLDGDGLDVPGRLVLEPDDDPAATRAPEAHRHDRAPFEPVREVRVRPRDGARGDERDHGGEPGHGRSTLVPPSDGDERAPRARRARAASRRRRRRPRP